jgi:hypothetical protein
VSPIRRHFALWFALFSWAATSLLAALAPFGAGAVVPTEATAFSADRARSVLHRLIGNDVPHPVGSRENREVRSRIEQ